MTSPVETTGNRGAWRTLLTPLRPNDPIAGMLASIVITGGKMVDGVEIRRTNGDSERIAFLDQAVSSVALSGDDARLLNDKNMSGQLSMKIAALAWALVVATAGAVLIFQLHRGIELQTDITALLPFEERDATIRRAKDRVTEILTERVFLLVGDNDRANARAGGAMLAKALTDSGMTRTVTYRTPSDSLEVAGRDVFSISLRTPQPTQIASV